MAGEKLRLRLTNRELLKNTRICCRNANGLSYLLAGVCDSAGKMLNDNAELANRFGDAKAASVVMSIDIRRSTDLMLRAKSAREYAGFLTEACSQSRHYQGALWIIDKFHR